MEKRKRRGNRREEEEEKGRKGREAEEHTWFSVIRTQVVSNQDCIFQHHLTVITSPRSYILNYTGVIKFSPSHILLHWLLHLDCLHSLF